MRLINKPDLKQTLITTGACFVAGLVTAVIFGSPWAAEVQDLQLFWFGLSWGFAAAWSVRRMPGARKGGMVVFPLLNMIGWLCVVAMYMVANAFDLPKEIDNFSSQLIYALVATINFTLFNAYYRRKPPLLNYVIVFVLGWLSIEVMHAWMKLWTFDDAIGRALATMCVTQGALLGLGLALSLPKPQKPQEALEEEYNLLK